MRPASHPKLSSRQLCRGRLAMLALGLAGMSQAQGLKAEVCRKSHNYFVFMPYVCVYICICIMSLLS